MVLKLDLRDDEVAQDMICLIMNDKNLQTPEKAVQSAVNEELKKRLISVGWASIAYSIWGHDWGHDDGFERPFCTLEEPIFDVQLSDTQWEIVREVASSEKTDETTAVCYLLLFAMEQLGYHV